MNEWKNRNDVYLCDNMYVLNWFHYVLQHRDKNKEKKLL